MKPQQQQRARTPIGRDAAGRPRTYRLREILGVDVGPSEDGAFWLRCLRSLVSRGLSGVTLVISDAPEGLKGAIAAVLQGASWQRCRTHCVSRSVGAPGRGEEVRLAA